jgi:hypothetical protein
MTPRGKCFFSRLSSSTLSTYRTLVPLSRMGKVIDGKISRWKLFIRHEEIQIEFRVARFFLAKNTKTVKIHQITIKYTKWLQNIPSGRKIYQTFSIPRPSKIVPNLDLWYANLPSGNPDRVNTASILFMHLITKYRFLKAVRAAVFSFRKFRISSRKRCNIAASLLWNGHAVCLRLQSSVAYKFWPGRLKNIPNNYNKLFN